MGEFSYGSDPITIGDTGNIVLERLPIQSGDRELFRQHRTVTYTATRADGSELAYTVPPPTDPEFVTDLTSVPQLLTWLVPKSGKHLPAALVHDGLVDETTIDRFEADQLFRDGMGDLDVGFIRRWIMWTAVSIETIRRRGGRLNLLRTFGSLFAVALLGAAATINLAIDRTVLPWMGTYRGLDGFLVELGFGLAGATVIPIALGLLFWAPVRTAGVIAGVAIAVLFHAMVLTAGVYGFYRLLERTPRGVQQVVGAMIVALAAAAFVWSFLT
jgi:hypothetical protein